VSLTVEYVPAGEIEPHPSNPRKGSVDAVRESIRENGVYKPIIVQRSTGYILAGNHTYRAMVAEGMKTVPVTYTDAEGEDATRILLIDNRSSDLAGYYEPGLIDLLKTLPDLTGTGYDDAALADLVHRNAFEEPQGIPDQGETEANPYRTRSFTLTEEQAAVVDEAIRQGIAATKGRPGNKNARALIWACRRYTVGAAK
jgi:hypothetical protein